MKNMDNSRRYNSHLVEESHNDNLGSVLYCTQRNRYIVENIVAIESRNENNIFPAGF